MQDTYEGAQRNGTPIRIGLRSWFWFAVLEELMAAPLTMNQAEIVDYESKGRKFEYCRAHQ